ncbi:MAG: SH3 domain-containing protein [Proteobacteria bacterium]|nr:SH3 domain-containing protein [Pseudomonadota bacterium]MCP4915901.1 SH3 domain-containing protein [Pseudomonadota bacterium]
MLTLLLACAGEAPAPTTQEPVVEAEPEPTPVYVTASVLKLREEADGKVMGRLAINSPVIVIEEGEHWTHVRVANGKEGWVGTPYLGDAPLTAEQARGRAKAEPDNRLEWLQRAAAIQSDRPTLSALAAEYRALGENDRAAIVEKQLGWNPDLLAVTTVWSVKGEGIQVQWRPHDWETEDGKHGTLTAAELQAEGLHVGRAWWVLPNGGPAFEAKLKRAEHIVTNECAGTSAITLFLEGALPEGEKAIAATMKTPPDSWNTTLTTGISREEAEKRAWAAVGTDPTSDQHSGELSLVPTTDGWFARIVTDTSDDTVDWFERQGRMVDVRLSRNRTETLRDESMDLMEAQGVIGHRDLDGDGQPELILGGCSTAFLDGTDSILFETDWECCGC